MKVVVSAQGNDIDSLVDPRFGRCRWLIVIDTETGEWRSHDNWANANAGGGAGVEAGSQLVSIEAGVLVAGHLGPNAQRVLDKAGIQPEQEADKLIIMQSDKEEAPSNLPSFRVPISLLV